MTASTLLDILQARGISIHVEGEDLKLRPAGALDDDLLNVVRTLKPELFSLLTEPTVPHITRDTPPVATCYPRDLYDPAAARAHALSLADGEVRDCLLYYAEEAEEATNEQ